MVHVDVYDRLPTPFGLVRGGVAPDHQKIKSVTRVYDKIAGHPELRFYGNVEIGRDLSPRRPGHLLRPNHLRDRHAHRPSSPSPANLAAGTRRPSSWAGTTPSGLPPPRFDLSNARTAVVGNGNVAMDVTRILADRPRSCCRHRHRHHALRQLRPRPGARDPSARAARPGARAPPHQRGADARSSDLDRRRRWSSTTAEPAARRRPWRRAWPPTPERARDLQPGDPPRATPTRPPTGASRRIVLHFLVSPVEILGRDRVEALVVVHNELYESEDGSMRPQPTGRRTTLPVGLVFRAIGYQGIRCRGSPSTRWPA